MVRLFKGLLLAAAALVLFVAAVWLVSRAMGPSKAEREALALVDAPPPAGGKDGFAALWALGYDIPASEQGRVLADDIRSLAALPPLDLSAGGGASAWRSAREAWPRLGQARDADPAWCGLREAGCLERVRAAPDDYERLLGHHARLLEQVGVLSAYDRFSSPLPARMDAPFPEFQWLTRTLTRDASQFVQGETAVGLAGACAGVSQGRTLIAAGDSLIGSMIGAALVQGNATLLAEMLAELPRDHALPATCDAAFALPLGVEEAACRALLAEGRFATAGLRSQITPAIAADVADRDLPTWGARLLFDPERTAARSAPKFAWYCSAQARELIAQDRPLRDPAPPPSRWSLACASNPIGCILADIAAPAYVDYGLRLQDADARLRTTAALLWLRGREGAIDQEALAQVPAPMRSPARPLQLDLEAGTLGTALHAKPRTEEGGLDGAWSVPLPASRLQSAVTSP
ncbi:hypothetical protein MNQ95_12670 [Pseudoxanthomonas daejeonensis]|uniref:hypothetical protein n=1 Tax=Pseudoxanthomonas daejeonensis TaxID=266062 RepID=UPI001F54268B|nr:hypothetical protein [Pseudoxanthomonas daejeonensis]UNK56987.1 hypothetical protein MNQ95_12670 [Pseudoxanthomonas daejeonensis]